LHQQSVLFRQAAAGYQFPDRDAVVFERFDMTRAESRRFDQGRDFPALSKALRQSKSGQVDIYQYAALPFHQSSASRPLAGLRLAAFFQHGGYSTRLLRLVRTGLGRSSLQPANDPGTGLASFVAEQPGNIPSST
jgi:hypothetical protein